MTGAQFLSRLRETGVLGMNRRNADYIMRCNPRSAFPVVDDKVLTKRRAAEHGIPTPELIDVIAHHGDVQRFEDRLVGRKEFVLKPARGAGGSGIVLLTDRTPDGFVKQDGATLSARDIQYLLSDILSGIYSLEGLEDRVVVEALVHAAPLFADVTYRGVPDIRLLVYRGVPVLGMVRLPTRASDGKANLHRGAIGAGIDLRSGETLTAVHGTRLITRHPDTGKPVNGIRVPQWDAILVLAARALDMTGLGYLGVDLVLDRDRGPLLLELNARPGLAIQLANGAGLLRRLDAVDRAPAESLATPDARAAWAKAAFDGDAAERRVE